MLWIPPIDTDSRYAAPPPGARCLSVAVQVSTLDLVRSHARGTELVIVAPALMFWIASLGVCWQSVERHQVSLPLVIVNVCVELPTFIVQSFVLLLVSEIDSCGFSSAE